MTRRRIIAGTAVWLAVSGLLVWRQYDQVIGNLEAQVIIGGWPLLGAAAWLKQTLGRHHAERMARLDDLHTKVDALRAHLGIQPEAGPPA